MKFTVVGGDGRMLSLISLLREEGHSVAPFALEKAAECSPLPPGEDPGTLILPLPAEKNGALFAPFSNREHGPGEILGGVPGGTPVLAGRASPALAELCRERGLPLHDYFRREDFSLRMAELTAEGAVGLLMNAAPAALMGRRVLIYGFGRIGKALVPRLQGLGARVCICARSPLQRMEARAMGCAEARFDSRPGADYVVNTVPAPHLRPEDFPGKVCLELASPPYGFPAGAIGGAVLDGSALPGKYAPHSAAEAIKQAVYAILSEEEIT